jgi:FlaA1/EpsC-like NDP-sugar epimerase
LSGLKPHEDIEIVFTGLRPGEKLEEVLSYRLENVTETEHPQISRLVSPVQDYNYVRPLIDKLALAAEDLDLSADELKELLVKAVPEYTPFVASVADTSRSETRGSLTESSVDVLPALSGMVSGHP